MDAWLPFASVAAVPPMKMVTAGLLISSLTIQTAPDCAVWFREDLMRFANASLTNQNEGGQANGTFNKGVANHPGQQ